MKVHPKKKNAKPSSLSKEKNNKVKGNKKTSDKSPIGKEDHTKVKSFHK